MRECPQCGRSLADDATSCGCGWAAEENPEEPASIPEPTASESEAEEQPEESDLFDEEDEPEEDEGAFEAIPEGPHEEITYRDARARRAAPVQEKESSGLLGIVAIVVFVIVVITGLIFVIRGCLS